MHRVTPKKLQREKKFGEALEQFTTKYVACLEEGDRFLSAIYMDEIVQTLLESSAEGAKRQEQALRHRLLAFKERIPEKLMPDYEDDIEIALRKRFPEKHGVEKTKGEEDWA